MIAAEDEPEAYAALEDLQQAYYDFVPVANFGHRVTPSGLRDDFTGYEFVTCVGEIFHHIRPAE